MAGTAHEGMPVAGESGVVVADDLPGLGIPLARGQDAGTGVFQHGDQEGEDVTLGVHVLDGAVDGGPLPFPPARFGFIVAPVALPECDVAGGKPFGPAFFTADERDGFPAGIGGPEGIRQRFSVVGKCRNRKFGKTVVLAAVDFAESVGAVALGHQFPELVLEPFDVTRPPGIVHQLLAEIEVQNISPFHGPGQFEVRPDGCAALQPCLQGIDGGLELPCRLGRKFQGKTEDGKAQKEGKGLAHGYRCLLRSKRRTRRVETARAARSARKSRTSPFR